MTVLARQVPGFHAVARSDLAGFVVYGDVTAEALSAAVAEALSRLNHGQDELALHVNCGSNLVTAGILAGIGALVGSGDHSRSLWERLPGAVLGATLALCAAVPAGRWVQANVTTSAQVSRLRVAGVLELPPCGVRRHRVAIVTEDPS